MKSYWILFLCLSCLLASGCCGARKRQVSALERENSQLNGLLWEMEFQMESLEDENGELKQRLASEEDGESSTPSRPARTTKSPTEAAPFDPGKFRPPVIDFPSEPSPDGTVPDSLIPGGFEDGLLPRPGQSSIRQPAAPVSVTSHEEPALLEPRIEIVPPEEVSLDSERIERIELASMIGTLHSDDKAGDDGLVIVVEPWDGSDQMLADAAEVRVVLIDPAEPAETSRYAQWHFEAEETTKLYRDGDLPGLHLELPWPGDPPRHDRLHLFVRYTTSDGRKLEADSLVEVELGGRGRWMATDTPRVRPYEQAIVSQEASPMPPVAPQLLVADSEARTAEPVAASSRAPIRTVSTPRVRTARSDASRVEPFPAPESVVEAEPEPPARQRPAWSPDRPW
jgi:hypothetical protein